MANEELQLVRLRDEFYRDGFARVLFAMAIIVLSIGLLVAVSVFIIITKPSPVIFAVGNEARVIPPVPVDQAYLKTPDLIQWVTTILPKTFEYDFINYASELKDVPKYFTPNGWKIFSDVLNTYVNYNDIQTKKLFVTAAVAGAPFILNQGLLQGRYAWWVQMPLTIGYSSYDKTGTQVITIQALVVRVPTIDNFYGVAIDNIIVQKGEGNQQARTNG